MKSIKKYLLEFLLAILVITACFLVLIYVIPIVWNQNSSASFELSVIIASLSLFFGFWSCMYACSMMSKLYLLIKHWWKLYENRR